LDKPKKDQMLTFPSDKMQNLRENVLVGKWYIPIKTDEAVGVCLISATEFAKQGMARKKNVFDCIKMICFSGKLETNVECKEFVEKIVPEAFRKVNTMLLMIEKQILIYFSCSQLNQYFHGHEKFNVESSI
jgi:hypothetical protein